MPRPPDVHDSDFVDATLLAAGHAHVHREFSGAQLPRFLESGAAAESRIEADLEFASFDGAPSVQGRLQGVVQVVCQRCMQPMPVEVDEEFKVLIVVAERADEPGGYEPVISHPGRLDLRWLVEDQAQLALPLVPMHQPGACAAQAEEDAAAVPAAQEDSPEEDAESVTQKPFENLRDLLRKR